MPVRDVYNPTLATLHLSMKTLSDTGDAQRVEAIPSDDIPVALTIANAKFTVGATVVTLASKLPGNGEEYVYLEAQTGDITWWDDGKDPSISSGHVLPSNEAMRISKSQFANFKMCRVTADAIAILSAYKSV